MAAVLEAAQPEQRIIAGPENHEAQTTILVLHN